MLVGGVGGVGRGVVGCRCGFVIGIVRSRVGGLIGWKGRIVG